MKLLTLLATLVVVALLGWTGASAYFVRGIEEPDYQVLEHRDSYEIRRYEPIVVAQTQAAPGDGPDEMFRVLAGYIFGGNDGAESIAMTAPVLMTGNPNDAREQQPQTMSFVMPSALTPASLPRPDDPRVRFETLPGRTVAALGFSWYATPAARRERASELVAMLVRDGIETAGEPLYAGYQPPFSAPFMMRHEILIEVTTP